MIRSEKVPLRYVVTSAIYWARWMWFGVIGSAPIFIYMGLHAREGSVPVLVSFWLMLLSIAIASGIASVHAKGIRRYYKPLEIEMVWLPGTWESYRDIEYYIDWLYAWTTYWTASGKSHMSPHKARELFRHMRMSVIPKKIPVATIEAGSAYIDFPDPDNKPEFAKAVTWMGRNHIETWVGEVDNRHDLWEYEWGHLLAEAEWGWSGESAMLEKRKKTKLLKSSG